MYSMDDLLELVNTERAEELRLHVGTPPVMVRRGEHHTVEGPVITAEDAEQFLLSIANTRQRREIRVRGWAQFFFIRGSVRFLVRARVKGENVGFDIR